MRESAVELELGRHAWTSLQGAHGEAGPLENALRELAEVGSREAAESAANRIERVVFAQGLLCEASGALAAGLVHCLWHRSEWSEDLILGLLSDISAGTVDESDPEVFGPVSRELCMAEICLGFPAYVEILETGSNTDSRAACIDLILMCGLSNPALRGRSIFFLENALRLDALTGHRDVLTASIDELRQEADSRQ